MRVAYPPSDFADEGIQRLTFPEEELFARAIDQVSSQPGYQEPFLVGVVCQDGQIQEITFSTYDGDKAEEFGRVTLSGNGL